jgi:hypothetical protein
MPIPAGAQIIHLKRDERLFAHFDGLAWRPAA